MSKNAIPINLKRIRIARGFTQDEAAQAAGLSRVAYSNIENGKAEPRVSNLMKLANALEVSAKDIVSPIPEISLVRFRSKQRLTSIEKSKREQIVTDVVLWLKDFQEIEEMVSSKVPYLFQEKKPREKASIPLAKKLAEEARTVLRLKQKEAIVDVCGLLESAGIKLHFIKSDLESFYGLSVFMDEGPAICVNVADRISVERQIFTLAHEFGHLLLHRNSFDVKEVNEILSQEKEADVFASYFLMPKKAFDDAWEENKGLHWVDNVLHIKRVFKVSYATVLLRLREEGFPESIWKSFTVLLANRHKKSLKNHAEPFPLSSIDFLEDRLGKLVREAYESDKISFGRAAEALNISVEEMRELALSWKIGK